MIEARKKVRMSIKEIKRAGIMERVIAKTVSTKEASVIMDISSRQVKRLKKQFREEGLIGRWRGSGRRHKEEFKAKIKLIVCESYKDFKPTFAAEKLWELDGLKVNRETMRQWMTEWGLWDGKKRKTTVTHQSRARQSRV